MESEGPGERRKGRYARVYLVGCFSQQVRYVASGLQVDVCGAAVMTHLCGFSLFTLSIRILRGSLYSSQSVVSHVSCHVTPQSTTMNAVEDSFGKFRQSLILLSHWLYSNI